MNRQGAWVSAVLVLVAMHALSAPVPLVTLTPGGGVLNLPAGPPIAMTTIGGGLRKKKVLFAAFRIYAARFLVSAGDAAKFERTPGRALDSLDQVPAVAMHLTFERSVSPQQLSDSLNAAMTANGYDVKGDADLRALARAIGSTGEIPSGSVCILAAVRVDPDTDLVVYQSPSGTISSVRGRSGFKHALMSAWFGKPADAGLRALRDDILGTQAGQ